jgi:putative Ca2+/H+ antiporter (TMEM165/GDT1 family)
MTLEHEGLSGPSREQTPPVQAGNPSAAGPEPASTATQHPEEPAGGWWPIFLTTTTTVFLAELGDKTQLAALLLSAESGEPLVVFCGTSLALISSSLVGVLLGRWLSSMMPPQQLERAAGIVMVAVGLWLGRQAVLPLVPFDSPMG